MHNLLPNLDRTAASTRQDVYTGYTDDRNAAAEHIVWHAAGTGTKVCLQKEAGAQAAAVATRTDVTRRQRGLERCL